MNRILYLLAKLQRGSVNLAVEARELGFSVRTLQRDILFIEEACFPIERKRGRDYTGWRRDFRWLNCRFPRGTVRCWLLWGR